MITQHQNLMLIFFIHYIYVQYLIKRIAQEDSEEDDDDDEVDDGLNDSCSPQLSTSLGPASSRPTPIKSR